MFASHRQNRRNLILPVAILAAHALAMLLFSSASAATRSWDAGGGADTAFTTDANWSSNLEPGASDIALFDRGAAFNYTVTFPRLFPLGDIANDRLVVGSNTVTFEPAFPTDYFLDNTTTIEADPILGTPVRGITIGADSSDTAAVLVSHLALLEAVAATLGHATGSSGTLTLNQSNDLLNITGGSTNAELIIGRLGTGILNVLAGADVTVNGNTGGMFPLPAGSVSLGRASSGQGTANISGAGSTLDVNTLLVVGDAGSGTLNVTAGGIVESLSGILGDLAGSTGTATISGAGSRWNVGVLFVGDAGTGTLNVLDGGTVDITSAGGININGGSTLHLDAGTIDGIVNNSGQINVTGPATISGSLDNAAGADTLIDWAEPVGVVGLDVVGDITNAGAVNIMIDYAEPVGIAALHAGGNVTNSGSVNLTINYAEPVGIAALDVDGSLTNSGVVSVNVDYAEPVGARPVAVAGNVTNNGTFDLMIDWAEPVGLVALDVGGAITNNGAINITRAAEQDLTVQLGAGQTFTNGATGVVNLTGPGDINGDSMISGKHIVLGNVVNNGELNVRTNTQIEGSLTVAVNAETVVEPASLCCGMVFDVAGPVTNSGTFTMRSPVTAGAGAGAESGSGSSSHQDVVLVAGGGVTNSGTFTMEVDTAEPISGIVQLGGGQTFTNTATGVVNLNGPEGETIEPKHIIAGNVDNSGQMNIRTNTQIDGTLTVANNAETKISPGCAGCSVELVTRQVTSSGTVNVSADSMELVSVTIKLDAGETLTINNTGALKGAATVDGNVLNHGRIEPGNAKGVLTVTGDFTQGSDGTVVVEVAGTTAGSEYNQLAVGGEIALDGRVQVLFANDFAPQVGNRFEIITTAEPVGGKFADAFLPGLPAGMDWGIHYDANVVLLAISIPGDYNASGTVDAADYTLWQDSFGQTGAALAADGDGSDTIDAGDYDFWKSHFGDVFPGSVAGSGAALPSAALLSAGVPEPATLILFLVGLVAMYSRQRATMS